MSWSLSSTDNADLVWESSWLSDGDSPKSWKTEPFPEKKPSFSVYPVKL
nr:hypothetical protein [Corynebacterium glyciniphilum]